MTFDDHHFKKKKKIVICEKFIMNCTITLKATSFSNVPFDNYQKNFTFIVNDEEFSTNKIIADILSKKVSRNHLTDPTIDRYSIKTKNKGNFQTI